MSVQHREPRSALIGPQLPSWWWVAAAITDGLRRTRLEPNHPWRRRFPAERELVEDLSATRYQVRSALRFLAASNVITKGRVTYDDGTVRLRWVPVARQPPPAPTADQIIVEIMTRTLTGEWVPLPPLATLRRRLQVSHRRLDQAMSLLRIRGLALWMRVDGRRRLQIVLPHQTKNIDPRRFAPAVKVVVLDMIGRIRSGEFRYRVEGTVFERPLPSDRAMQTRYRIGGKNLTVVKAHLQYLQWIEFRKTTRGLVPYLPAHVAAVDFDHHPFGTVASSRRHTAGTVAEDLLARRAAGEFHTRPFPWRTEIAAHYGVTLRAVNAALAVVGRLPETRTSPHACGSPAGPE